MSKSTKSSTPGLTPAKKKPTVPKGSPLYAHASGRWCKRVKGRLHYFGSWKRGVTHKEAVQRWNAAKDYLIIGETPPDPDDDRLTVGVLAMKFLASKKTLLESGELAKVTYDDYDRICRKIVKLLGVGRIVEDLKVADFERLRADFAKTNGPGSLGNELTRIRVVLNYARKADLMAGEIRYGDALRQPSRKAKKLERADRGKKFFASEEIRQLLTACESVQLKAMILLAANAALGNADCGRLRRSNIDFKGGMLTFIRPKTGGDRRAALWPETLAAIEEALAVRPEPKDPANADLVFITKYGTPWYRQTPGCPISAEFSKIMKAQGLYRPHRSFYALRHTCRTIMDATRDFPAADLVMGHEPATMAARYTEHIDDERLRDVAEHVRRWLYKEELDTEGDIRTVKFNNAVAG